MQINNSILNLIGRTPLVELHNFRKVKKLKARIVAKVELFNPSGSIKDRAAFYMIKQAFDDKLIDKDSHIIEPTSGNTGIGLAMTCACLNLKLTLVLPENMSIERRAMLKAFGANLILTEAKLGMKGAIDKANELHAQEPNSFIPMQFENFANLKAHYETTGPEIYRETDGQVDILVAGVGTGGTISGSGLYLKKQNSKIKVIAVEPQSSPILSGGQAGPHSIQGIGAGFVPKIYNQDVVDEVIAISNEDAITTAKEVIKTDGIFCGISSGAALAAAAQLAQLDENKNKIIVVILPDSADRYLSTALFKD